MIARRFGMFATSKFRNYIDKIKYVKGYVECGGTIEDLAKSENLEDKKIAENLMAFINTLPSTYKSEFITKLSTNSVNRGVREQLSK